MAFSRSDEMYVTLVAGVPAKLTFEVRVNPTPVMMTGVPATPWFGLKPVTDNVGLNSRALFAVPTGVVTEIVLGPAPLGTTASICVGERMSKRVASAPNRTWLAPLNGSPVMTTELPVIADDGVTLRIVGMPDLTSAVCDEIAGAPKPNALLAVSCTRMVELMSAVVRV